jgi:hypothetical protein
MKELNDNVSYLILMSSGGCHILQKEAKILRHVSADAVYCGAKEQVMVI